MAPHRSSFAVGQVVWPALAMAAVVTASNFLVQYPVGDALTYAAFTYPFAFLVTDLTARIYGPRHASQAIAIGFVIGVALSFWLSTPRIAAASGIAFLAGQFLDLCVFQRLRGLGWWRAPLVSSLVGSSVDTIVFFGLAFVGVGFQVMAMMVGDLCAKGIFSVAMLVPFRIALTWHRQDANRVGVDYSHGRR